MRFVVAVALAASVLGAGCRHEKIVHDPGKPPPGFKPVDVDRTQGTAPEGSSVTKTDGTTVELDSLWKKNRVLLVFYLGGWCPHCKRQLETLQQYQKDIADAGAVIAAVSVDPPGTAKQLHDDLKLQFELYSDAELATISKWGVEDVQNHIALPATFIIEPGGAITYRKVGQNPTDRPTVEELLTALRNSQ